MKAYRSLLLKEVYASELYSEGRKFLNIDEFKKLDSPEEQTLYLEKNGSKIGQGSSRAVYLINSRQVLKMARQSNFYGTSFVVGQGQNEAEVDLFTNPTVKPFVAKIYDYDKNYNWLVSELVRPLRSSGEFEKLTGITWKDFRAICLSLHDGLGSFKILELKEQYKNNEFVKNLFEILEKTDTDGADLVDYEHLGKTNDDRIVLLDYGFSNSVRDRFY